MTTILEKAFPYIIAALLSAAGAWYVVSNDYDAKLANQRADYEGKLKGVSDAATVQANQSLERIKDAQQKIAALDEEKSRQLSAAQAANDDLKRRVSDGTKRVRLAEGKLATCVKSAGAVPVTGSVDAGTTVEFSTETGLDILDLRSSIIKDTAKLEALQAYIAELQKKGIIAGTITSKSTK